MSEVEAGVDIGLVARLENGTIVRPRVFNFIHSSDTRMILGVVDAAVAGDIVEIIDFGHGGGESLVIDGLEFGVMPKLRRYPATLPSWFRTLERMHEGKRIEVIPKWDLSRVPAYYAMFRGATGMLNMSGWKFGSNAELTSMFENADVSISGLGTADMSSVVSILNMFKGATERVISDISDWCVPYVYGGSGLFTDLDWPEKYLPKWGTCRGAHISPNVMRVALEDTNVVEAVLSGWLDDPDPSNNIALIQNYVAVIQWGNGIFRGSQANGIRSAYAEATYPDHLPPWLKNAFIHVSRETRYDLWDTSQVESFKDFGFHYDGDIRSGISNWNVSRVKDFSWMFRDVRGVIPPLKKWDVSSAEKMTGMFRYSSMNEDLSSWVVENVKEFERFHSGADQWKIRKPKWNEEYLPKRIDGGLAVIDEYGREVGVNDRSAGDLFNIYIDVTYSTLSFTCNSIGTAGIIGVVGYSKGEFFGMPVNRMVFQRLKLDILDPLPSWVNSACDMFVECEINANITRWKVGNVNNMDGMFSHSVINQDLSYWCVSQFDSKPSSFDVGVVGWTKPQPVWGTCPDMPDLGILIEDTGGKEHRLSTVTTEHTSYSSGTLTFLGSVKKVLNWDDMGDLDYPIHHIKFVGDSIREMPDYLPEFITSLKDTFKSQSQWDGYIPNWDFENVTDISGFLDGASSFKGIIEGKPGGMAKLEASWPTPIYYDDELQIYVDGKLIETRYADGDTKIVINFDPPLNNGERIRLEFYGDGWLLGSRNFIAPQDAPGIPPKDVNWSFPSVKHADRAFADSAFMGSLSAAAVGSMETAVEMFGGAFNFNSDLSEWCVWRIKEKPQGFDDGAVKWVLPRPNWGTCGDLFVPRKPEVETNESLLLSGNADPNVTIVIQKDGEFVASTESNADGNWSFIPHPIPLGKIGCLYAVSDEGITSELNCIDGMFKDGEDIEPPPPIEPPIEGEDAPVTLDGYSCVWRPIVMLNDVDVSSRLTGKITIDREENAAGIANFGLFFDLGESVDPDIAQHSVSISFVTGDVQQLRFTGFVAEPVWDAVSRVLTVTATDNLQERVESMSISEIDSLIGGEWSEHVFGELDGKSHWDYAQERLSTVLKTLDCSVDGQLRVTDLEAFAETYRFEAGTIVHDSLRLDLPRSKTVTNRYEIASSYRFPRLRQADYRYYWLHSYTNGSEGTNGFCEWRKNSTELPSQDMILSATEAAGLTTTQARWVSLPMSDPDPCGTGAPWINRFPDLLLGAEWLASRRWTQYMTEEYDLVVTTRFAEDNPAQRVINRSSISFDHDTDLARDWSSSLVPVDADGRAVEQSYEPEDNSDNSARDLMLKVKLMQAQCEIIKAHRASRVSFDVVSCFAKGIDITNRISVNDYGVKASGKCFSRTDVMDIDTGSCITTLTIALLRGSSSSTNSVTVPPALHSKYEPEPPIESDLLYTQIAGDTDYNEELDGFSGNRSISMAKDPFPRRMQISSPELSEDDQNESIANGTATHYVEFIEDELIIQ